jgi:hypothetical protein
MIKLRNLLKNEYVLYGVFFLAITNVLGYLYMNDFQSLTFFLVIGLLSTFFSKNMIVNLLVAIVSTNLLFARNTMREGMKGGKGKKKKGGEKHEDDSTKEGLAGKKQKKMTKKTKESMEAKKNKTGAGASAGTEKKKRQGFGQRNVPASSPESLEDEEIGKRIDYASTLEQAYDNLQNVLGKDGMSGLTKETQQLVAQQKSLMSTMKDIGPMVQMAMKTLSGLDMGSLKDTLNNVTGMMNTLKGKGT